jgi:quaternary ammonium compound-resistance protein SugE
VAQVTGGRRGIGARGTAYAVWVGIGALDESASPLRMGFLMLILVGIIGLKVVEG